MALIPATPDNIFNIGLFGIVLALILALVFPEPSQYQTSIFTVCMGLSGACVASGITGFLEIESRWIKAGGPLGVMVFLCLFISQSLPN